MLLIGDIHINARYADQILLTVQQYIDDHNQETNVLFLGDFVYHFAYHRQSLLQLFDMFLILMAQGKTVYVLAGNHDRIQDSFVFAEAQKAFQTIKQQSSETFPTIHFITEPRLLTIEGETSLFLPHVIDPKVFDLPLSNTESKQATDLLLIDIANDAETLQQSSHKGEYLSGKLNAYLLYQIHQHTKKSLSDKLIIYHHYYLAKTTFPGQKSIFSFKDIALHP